LASNRDGGLSVRIVFRRNLGDHALQNLLYVIEGLDAVKSSRGMDACKPEKLLADDGFSC
jgi:hypothetical protein